jgi:hypothetical protein
MSLWSVLVAHGVDLVQCGRRMLVGEATVTCGRVCN